MNTPRSKAPRRYVQRQRKVEIGEVDNGITDLQVCSFIGTVITTMPFLEECMVSLFSELTGIDDLGSARLVFRSIVNQKTRVDIMEALLTKAPQHINKASDFDAWLDEFKAISNVRNKYAHGLWFTSKDKKRFYLQESTNTYAAFDDPREITAVEVTQVVQRMTALLKTLIDRQKTLHLARALAASTHDLPELGDTSEGPAA